ncbi:hypothetical protein COO60DRAFT_1180631 [Scenedesmus sp. NREL 46B-D3]|nr:hypothetical protein COO60DRAFT_1180631 [Scenedesmus sp. NREL 46B-D3]
MVCKWRAWAGCGLMKVRKCCDMWHFFCDGQCSSLNRGACIILVGVACVLALQLCCMRCWLYCMCCCPCMHFSRCAADCDGTCTAAWRSSCAAQPACCRLQQQRQVVGFCGWYGSTCECRLLGAAADRLFESSASWVLSTSWQHVSSRFCQAAHGAALLICADGSTCKRSCAGLVSGRHDRVCSCSGCDQLHSSHPVAAACAACGWVLRGWIRACQRPRCSVVASACKVAASNIVSKDACYIIKYAAAAPGSLLATLGIPFSPRRWCACCSSTVWHLPECRPAAPTVPGHRLHKPCVWRCPAACRAPAG